MNLSDERNYQKLMDTLDALKLSEKNRKLAEEYLDTGSPEHTELLKQTERQDFSALGEAERQKSIDYVEHLRKRNKKEELGRYVRFQASAGGSTAFYIFNRYGWNLNSISEYLSPEQSVALQVEGMIWNSYSLNYRNTKAIHEQGRKDPEVLRKAMDLCYHRYDNAKVLLAGIYLNIKRSEEKRPGILKGLFGKGTSPGREGVSETLKFLEDNLIASMPEMFIKHDLGKSQMEELQAYVRKHPIEQPFPAELQKLLNKRTFTEYMLTLLSGAAFLAVEHSPVFSAFLQIAGSLSLDITLKACRDLTSLPNDKDSWFHRHLEELEALIPVKPEAFVRWYTANSEEEGLCRMAVRHPEAVRYVAGQITTDEYQFLLSQTRKSNPSLCRELEADNSDKYQAKLAEELVANVNIGKAEAKAYLLGETSLDTLYPFVNSWRGSRSYSYQRFQKLKNLQRNKGRLYRRGVVLEALRMEGSFFPGYLLPGLRGRNANKKQLQEEIERLVQLFEKEELPIRYQADAMEGIYSACYQEKDKNAVMDAASQAFSARWGEHADEIREAAKDSTAIGRCICVRALDDHWQEEKEVILASALDSSKQVREQLVTICTAHREWEPEMLSMLTSKKSQERELAIRVLKFWGVKSYEDAFAKALETEKSKKLRELLLDSLGMKQETAAEGEGPHTGADLVREILKGGKKRKVAWAYETPFPAVHKKDGSEAEEEYLQAILTAYADRSVPGVSTEAASLAADLEPLELGAYMAELFDKWLESGAEAKKKWVLYAASIHGGMPIVDVFRRQIQEWPQHARGAMAAEAVKALALNGTSSALLYVDQISRKFKFRQVKTAAGEALEYAASTLGISKAELEDRIVPNLGFDESLKRTFDYGTRSFSVYLTTALELEIFGESEKKLKNLPAPGKRDEEEKAAAAYAEFKQMKKQLKTVVSNQKMRLEQALTAERLWTSRAWEELFVKNPVMHQFAIGLIWGTYENGALKDTFRYMEDGSFNTRDEDEFTLPEDAQIGLVHPIELSQEDLAVWKEQLSDYEIVQPIEQLERPVYRVTEEETGKAELTRFGGKLLNGLSLSGKLQGMGWYRGSVQDAGVYYTFYREDGEMGVELEFSGCYVGDENDEVTVYGAAFYRAGTVKRGSYVYDTIKKENQHKLDEVSPRYFSEIVLQLAKATASSQEQLAYPACKQ